MTLFNLYVNNLFVLFGSEQVRGGLNFNDIAMNLAVIRNESVLVILNTVGGLFHSDRGQSIRECFQKRCDRKAIMQ